MWHKFYFSHPRRYRKPTHTNTQKCENLLANPRSQNNGRKTYVLDTSVLLADPAALARFAEHEVIIPITVIGELETKRDHPELGYFAREALRALDDLRISHGRLDESISINDIGGTIKVELNHSDPTSLPAGFLRDGSNDSRILAIARNLMAESRRVVLVTKDLPLRVKASSVGVESEDQKDVLLILFWFALQANVKV